MCGVLKSEHILVQTIELDCRIRVVGSIGHGTALPGFDEIELRQSVGGTIVCHQHHHHVQDEGGAGGGLQLGFVAGVILRERLPAFEKMLWRACRGNVFLRVAEIEDPLEDPQAGDQVFKSVFVTFFQGEQLKSRVKKICEGFRATLYPCPDQASDRREMAVGVMQVRGRVVV